MSFLSTSASFLGLLYTVLNVATKSDLSNYVRRSDAEPYSTGIFGITRVLQKMRWQLWPKSPFTLLNHKEFARWLRKNGFAAHVKQFDGLSSIEVLLVSEEEWNARVKFQTDRNKLRIKIFSEAQGPD